MNKKLFHQSVKKRRKKNRIHKLLNDDSVFVDDNEDFAKTVKCYFENIFWASDGNYEEAINVIRMVVSEEDNEKLIALFSKEEFKATIFYMNPDKSLGPDEFNLGFFQRFWNNIDDDVFSACCYWLENLSFLPGLNNTNLVLILKCESPTSMKDLMPIALCNVVYKILSKVFANRLKAILDKFVSFEQSAFAPRRAIIDNVLVAFA